MDETIGRSLGNESLEENLCILGVPKIRAGAETEGYNLSYFRYKSFFVTMYVPIKNANIVRHLQNPVKHLRWSFLRK